MSENNSAVKATKTIHDMTTGSPVKLIVQFMIPMFLGNIFQQFYNVADSIIAGQFLGVRALAAIGSTGSLMFFVTYLSGSGQSNMTGCGIMWQCRFILHLDLHY